MSITLSSQRRSHSGFSQLPVQWRHVELLPLPARLPRNGLLNLCYPPCGPRRCQCRFGLGCRRCLSFHRMGLSHCLGQGLSLGSILSRSLGDRRCFGLAPAVSLALAAALAAPAISASIASFASAADLASSAVLAPVAAFTSASACLGIGRFLGPGRCLGLFRCPLPVPRLLPWPPSLLIWAQVPNLLKSSHKIDNISIKIRPIATKISRHNATYTWSFR